MKDLMKNKKFMIASIIVLFLLLIGGVYAIVVWTTTNYNVTLNTSCFDVDYELGQNINATLNPTYALDVIDDRANTITINSDMAVSNVSLAFDSACTRYTGIATLELNVLTINNAFTDNGNSTNSLKYYLIPYDSEDYPTVNISTLTGETFEYITSGSITSTGTRDIYSTTLDPHETKEYIIVFLIDSSFIDTDIIGATFTGTVNARVEQDLSTPITDFEYTTDLGEGIVTLNNYIGTSKTVVVPSTYTIEGVTYNVVLQPYSYIKICRPRCTTLEISSTFMGNTNIETVYLSENINNTDLRQMFGNCTSLKSVPVLPNSVTNLLATFSGCTSLVNAPAIPNSVTSLENTFKNCTSLVTAPTIGSSVEDMSDTFSGCTSLVNASTIPNSVTNMTGTFLGCTSLVNAPTIGSSVEYMASTFEGCTSLVNASTIPSGVTTMENIFKGCTNLTGTIRINAPASRMADAFYGTEQLITAEVPAGSDTYIELDKGGYPANVTVTTFTP